MVLPCISYCNIVWASNYPTNLERLVKLQKRAVRIISQRGKTDHTSPLFKSLKILKVTEINILQTSIFMFKLSRHLVPKQFLHYFSFNMDIHNHYTRSHQHYHLQCSKTNSRKFSIKFRGPIVYNNVPSYIKDVSNVYRCKQLLKSFLIAKY